jgi:hypothetical protein
MTIVVPYRTNINQMTILLLYTAIHSHCVVSWTVPGYPETSDAIDIDAEPCADPYVNCNTTIQPWNATVCSLAIYEPATVYQTSGAVLDYKPSQAASMHFYVLITWRQFDHVEKLCLKNTAGVNVANTVLRCR